MTLEDNLRVVEGLEPASVWRFFAEIASVPRPSKKETKIREHMRHVAASLGLTLHEDAIGNQVVEVPATKGYESAPITVLQGHLDMVCEKNAGTQHDFDNDPIRLVVETEESAGKRILRADGTTLGADNGVGVAMALAAATSPDVVHGPLELLMTIDEEMGMTGANALTPESFRGRCMLNLDSEEDDSIYIGCAGGCDTNLTWRIKPATVPAGAECVRVIVRGLRGGHSGGDIHEGRGNAIRILAETLRDAKIDGLQIVEVRGGSKRNAIPREAEVTLVGPAGLVATLSPAAQRVRIEAAKTYHEPQLDIAIEPATPTVKQAVPAKDTQTLVTALLELPNGVLGMHPTVDDLVETSNNVATITMESPGSGGDLQITVGTLARSSSGEKIQETLDSIAMIGRKAGAVVEHANGYPGWAPDLDSPILARARRLYGELFEHEPKVLAIHAGLECGIIGERVGDMDMTSIGPTIMGAHSPDERIYIDSVPKSWTFLKAILEDIAKG